MERDGNHNNLKCGILKNRIGETPLAIICLSVQPFLVSIVCYFADFEHADLFSPYNQQLN